MKTYQTNVMWDLTLTNIYCSNSQYGPLESQGLVVSAEKFEGTVPDAVPGKYLPGATVKNTLTGVWYRNTGSTLSPVFTVWPI